MKLRIVLLPYGLALAACAQPLPAEEVAVELPENWERVASTPSMVSFAPPSQAQRPFVPWATQDRVDLGRLSHGASDGSPETVARLVASAVLRNCRSERAIDPVASSNPANAWPTAAVVAACPRTEAQTSLIALVRVVQSPTHSHVVVRLSHRGLGRSPMASFAYEGTLEHLRRDPTSFAVRMRVCPRAAGPASGGNAAGCAAGQAAPGKRWHTL
jgi:hypothetical protein